MSELNPSFAEFRDSRQDDYLPIDIDTAQVLAGYLDNIIDANPTNRSAVSGEHEFKEWTEKSVEYAQILNDVIYHMPTVQHRMMLRRTIETSDDALGETYQIIIEWSVSRTDLVDNGYTKSYVLMIPNDVESEAPKLLTCHQQSAFIGTQGNRIPNVGTINSSYHEADLLLDKSFYTRHTVGTVYDANELFDELQIFEGRVGES